MANPLVPQGTLNRLRGSIVIPLFPQLNITASFLGKEGISISFEGDTTTTIPTMTGVVQSPEPYQMARIAAHMLKSQSLAALWEAQRLSLSLIGDVVLTTDSLTMPKYILSNCSIMNVDEIKANGDNAEYGIVISGIYLINASLWAG